MSKVDELLDRIEDSDLREELRRELEKHDDLGEDAENSEEGLARLLEDLLKRIPEEVPPVERRMPWVERGMQVTIYGPQPVDGTADGPQPTDGGTAVPPGGYRWVTTSGDSVFLGDDPDISGNTLTIGEKGFRLQSESFTITTTDDLQKGR
jgi:hypothetical protein